MLAPFDYQRRSAALALLIRRLLHPLDGFHVLRGVPEVLLEFLVKIAERLYPTFFALLDLIEFFFQPCRVLHVEDVTEVFDQQIGYNQANLRRRKFPAEFLHVLAFLDRA